MKTCMYCGEQIQDAAVKCRYCGEFLDESCRPSGLRLPGMMWGYEYKSDSEIMGWPLVHVAYGINPKTGLPHVAKGIIAIGNFAVGLVAVGGFALGGITLAGIGLGAFILAGIAIGGVALGGIAVGLYLALGGLAVSSHTAFGGLALAPRNFQDICANSSILRVLFEFFGGRCP